MARTDSTMIADVIEWDDTIDLTPFISVANELVTELCSDSGYSESRLTMIETWLAAHFYTVRDPRATSESIGGVSESKQMHTGANLMSSEYGQTAMSLDTAGNLNLLNKKVVDGKGKKSASISALVTDSDRAYYGVS